MNSHIFNSVNIWKHPRSNRHLPVNIFGLYYAVLITVIIMLYTVNVHDVDDDDDDDMDLISWCQQRSAAVFLDYQNDSVLKRKSSSFPQTHRFQLVRPDRRSLEMPATVYTLPPYLSSVSRSRWAIKSQSICDCLLFSRHPVDLCYCNCG